MVENPRKFKNLPKLLVFFVKITKFLEFSKKQLSKTIVFSNSVFGNVFFIFELEPLFEFEWVENQIEWRRPVFVYKF